MNNKSKANRTEESFLEMLSDCLISDNQGITGTEENVIWVEEECIGKVMHTIGECFRNTCSADSNIGKEHLGYSLRHEIKSGFVEISFDVDDFESYGVKIINLSKVLNNKQFI